MKSLDTWIQENIRHNRNTNYDHIQDDYLKGKLKDGLIKYNSKEWSELAYASLLDDKELKRKGVS